nr:reverse transcriptase domain-containing protein [Tanacetum cinerariifolium]
MPLPVHRRDDIPETEMPPRKRLCLSTLGSSTLDAEMRRRGIREVGYGIRDTWVDPIETVPEIEPMTMGEVNTRVTELAELHEHDTQDLYTLLEDAQDKDEAYAVREAWAHSIRLRQAVHSELQTHQEQVQIMAPVTRQGPSTLPNNTNPNNMTPKSIQAMIDQALLRNSTNGDGNHRIEGVVGLTRWIEKMESVFQISGCAIENQVKFATCTLLDAALTWWNSQIRSLGPDAYSMTWEVLKKKMTDKYCPQGETKKLEIELWNLKVKENNVPAYTERFQELTLICTKFVADETEKVNKCELMDFIKQ